jgi:hypothetical protein
VRAIKGIIGIPTATNRLEVLTKTNISHGSNKDKVTTNLRIVQLALKREIRSDID